MPGKKLVRIIPRISGHKVISCVPQYSLNRYRKGEVGVGHRRVEGQVNDGLAAAVPVAVRNAGGKDDERTGSAFVLLSLDLDAHRAAYDVEDLVDGMGMHPGRGAATGGRLVAHDRTVLGARCLIVQSLGHTLVSAALLDGREINLANVLHGDLLTIEASACCAGLLHLKAAPGGAG